MQYLRRRKLRGLALKRFTVVLPEEAYRDLQGMKGTLGNSAAIELLIRQKKARALRAVKAQVETRGRS